MFSTNGFQTPLFKQAVLSDFSTPTSRSGNNDATIDSWRNWLIKNNQTTPWFSFLQIDGHTNKASQKLH